MCKPGFMPPPDRLATLLGLVLLAGCAGTTGPVTTVDLTGPERQAQEYAAAGDTSAAVAIYADLHGRSIGSARAAYALAAAELLLDAGDGAAARDWLGRAEADATPEQHRRLLVLTADVALLDGDAQAALDQLDAVELASDSAPSLRAMAARGRALFELGRIEEAVRVLVEREDELDGDEDILANHELIWNGLSAQSRVQPMVASGDPVIDGWLALLPVAVARRSDPFGLAQGLEQWLADYPNHPAARLLVPGLREQDRLAQTYPAQVALLLPLSSLPEPAAAVRDGFIAAYLRNPAGAATRLRIYDTDAGGSEQAYLQAQLDGAEFIVGPLRKPEVERIAASSGFIPTLALNTVDTPMSLPSNFFQFGLAPEDEVAEAVRHAVASGAKRAVALFPNSDRGLRLFESFRRDFTSLGGQLLEFRAYDTGTQDFSAAITSLLNLDDSARRHQRLAANLAMPIAFQPRRRQDVDMIFFAAEPRAARLLAPQFRFHFAGDVPTYATSDIYDTATGNEPDLNGVIFADTPWLLAPDDNARMLRESLRRYWPQRTARWLRLYGLGFDAYRMIPMLNNGSGSLVALRGMSGELWLASDGRIHRRLPVAQFRNGQPETLSPAEAVDSVDEEPLLSLR